MQKRIPQADACLEAATAAAQREQARCDEVDRVLGMLLAPAVDPAADPARFAADKAPAGVSELGKSLKRLASRGKQALMNI